MMIAREEQKLEGVSEYNRVIELQPKQVNVKIQREYHVENRDPKHTCHFGRGFLRQFGGWEGGNDPKEIAQDGWFPSGRIWKGEEWFPFGTHVERWGEFRTVVPDEYNQLFPEPDERRRICTTSTLL